MYISIASFLLNTSPLEIWHNGNVPPTYTLYWEFPDEKLIINKNSGLNTLASNYTYISSSCRGTFFNILSAVAKCRFSSTQ